VALPRAVRPTEARFGEALAKVRYESLHRLAVAPRCIVARVGRGP
jgi:hypothetical protein